MEWSRDKRICSFGAQCLYRPSSKIKMIETIKEDLLKYLKFDLKMSEGGPINHMNLWIGDFFKHYVSEGVWLGLFSVRNHFPEGKYLKYTLTNINDIILFDKDKDVPYKELAGFMETYVAIIEGIPEKRVELYKKLYEFFNEKNYSRLYSSTISTKFEDRSKV